MDNPKKKFNRRFLTHFRTELGVITSIVSCVVTVCGCSSGRLVPQTPRAGISEALPRSTGPLYEKSHPAEMRDYSEIESLYSRNNLESFQKRAALFSSRNPNSLLISSLENLWGLILLKNKKSVASIPHFKKAIDLNLTNPAFNQYILFNLATALWDSNQVDEAQQRAESIRVENLNQANQIKVCYLKATLYQKKSLPFESAKQLLQVSKLYTESEYADNRRNLNKLLMQALQNVSDISLLEQLYQSFQDSPSADALLFRLGTQELAVGKVGNSESHLKALTTRFPLSPYFAQANEMLNQSQTQASADPQSIGILLPLKGKLAKYGAKSLQGVEFAFDLFNPKAPDSRINLIIEDSGDETEQTINALHRLIFKHHVVAVIGPMVSKGIEQISQRAQELGVPLISLARRAGPPLDYVFQAGLTQQLEASEIARYAIQKLGLQQFAILYPKDKLGAEMAQSFWDTVDSLGGSVVGSESYNPGETDFRQPVDKLSGLYYSEARQRELDQLTQDRETNHITKRSRKTEQYFGLKPIVDYQAVFIPDEAKIAGQILPTFAYRDVEQIHFLGSSSWNSPDFLSRAQSYGDGSYIVDAYFPLSQSPLVRSFAEKYKTAFGQDPSSLEALAYDAALILKKILTQPGKTYNRADLRDQLKQVTHFPGITGTISYKDGQFVRDLRLLTVKNGQFIQAQ